LAEVLETRSGTVAIGQSSLRRTGGTITATIPLDLLRHSSFPKVTLDALLKKGEHKADIVVLVSEGQIVISVVDMPFHSLLGGLHDSIIKPAIAGREVARWQLGRLGFASAILRSRALDHDVGDDQDVKSTLLALESMLSGSVESLRQIREADRPNPELEQMARETIEKVANAIAKWSKTPQIGESIAQSTQLTGAEAKPAVL